VTSMYENLSPSSSRLTCDRRSISWTFFSVIPCVQVSLLIGLRWCDSRFLMPFHVRRYCVVADGRNVRHDRAEVVFVLPRIGKGPGKATHVLEPGDHAGIGGQGVDQVEGVRCGGEQI